MKRQTQPEAKPFAGSPSSSSVSCYPLFQGMSQNSESIDNATAMSSFPKPRVCTFPFLSYLSQNCRSIPFPYPSPIQRRDPLLIVPGEPGICLSLSAVNTSTLMKCRWLKVLNCLTPLQIHPFLWVTHLLTEVISSDTVMSVSYFVLPEPVWRS